MLRWPDRIPGVALYSLAVCIALAELAILWLAIHPQVSPEFRAYYIDRTTTCLPQPGTGAYVLGTEIDFRSGGPDTRQLRSCGWDGPAGDGLHALGESSMLHLATNGATKLTLMLELTGVTLPGPPQQRIEVSVNGATLGRVELAPDETRRFVFDVPPSALEGHDFADVRMDFPDAITPREGVANNYKRSIKLVAASLSSPG
jgi:hypothetical protein